MKRQIPPIIFYGLVAVALMVGLQLLTEPGNPDYRKGGLINQPAPEIAGETVEKKPIKLSDYKGKVVVVNFWATWCAPCRMEMPGFVALEKKYRDQGVVFLGVVMSDELPKAAQYAKENQLVWPQISATTEISQAYGGVPALPTTFIISRKGTVAAKIEGMAEEGPLEVEIAAQL